MQDKASNGGHRKSDKRERIRIPLKRETDCHGAKAPRNDRGGADCRAPCGGLACRLGRCFCFAEVSTGHPHRNDEKTCHSEREA